MSPRWVAASIVGAAAVVLAVSACPGRAAPYTRAAVAEAKRATWKTIVSVGHADALAIDLRGNPNRAKWAYVVNGFNRTVTKFGTGGTWIASWKLAPQTRYQQAVGVAVGGSGNVFIADTANNRVVKFDPSGRQLAVFDGFNMPRSVALDHSGNIYVAEQNTLQVTKLSTSGQILAHWHVPWVNGAGSGVPIALAVDRQGSVYVGVDCYQEECPPPHGIQYAVVKLNASGVMQSNLVGNNPYTGMAKEEEPFVTVNAVAVDRKDNLYIGGTIRNAKGQFSPGVLMYGGGTYRRTGYTVPDSGAPVGIAFDGRNTLYVAQGSRVLKRVPLA